MDDAVPLVDDAKLYGVSQTAAKLGIAPKTLRQWVDAGKFPPHDYRVDGVRKWSGLTIARWKQVHQ